MTVKDTESKRGCALGTYFNLIVVFRLHAGMTTNFFLIYLNSLLCLFECGFIFVQCVCL